MRVLVDTCVWSLALRRAEGGLSPREKKVVTQLRDLIGEGNAVLIGPIRQELLSGIRDESVFERLRAHLRAFEDDGIGVETWEEAARVGNACRAAGISGSAVDYLICAVALTRRMAILTTDRDFASYARVLPLTLLPLHPAAKERKHIR